MIDYDPHHWFDHFFDIKGSMFREIVGRVAFLVVWAAAVTAVHHFVFPLAIPATVHTLVGTALGLLLVFRTNASYDRFWEGRKMWGGIINETRNLCRAAWPFLKTEPARFRELTEWVTAFPYASMNHLRGSSGVGPSAPETVRAMETAQHVPLAVARGISERLAEARAAGLMTEYAQMSIDQYNGLLIQYLGACERIHRTPLPFAYVVHLRRALILYCMTLPFALLEPFHWWDVPAVLMLSYTFLGIEEIGVEIEDPFGEDENDLPLERFCETIEGNLRGLVVSAPGPGPQSTP
ncbi:MAG: bestrophin family protein [Bryobacteraceae bacterium]|nr:bestrophin family protein [Bryobacteraceae bacterium]